MNCLIGNVKRSIFALSQVAAVLFFLNLAGPSAVLAASTSEIPAKREFPLSPNINPCVDFHKYVCSEAEAGFKLREDRSMHTFAFNDSDERILDAKKAFFKKINQEKNLSPRDLQVKNVYMACMNEKAGVKQEKKALGELQKELSSAKNISDFMNLNMTNLLEGKESLIDFGSDANKDNSDVYDVVIRSDLMNLPEYSYYDNAELMKDYKSLVVDFLKIAEPKTKAADIEKRADALIAFEKEFVKIYPHPEVQRQRWSEKRQFSQKEIETNYPALHLEKILSQTPEKLLVSNPFPESLEFLQKHGIEENLATLKDFFLFSAGHGYLDDSNPAYFKKYFEFNRKYFGGPNKRPERDERCTKSVMRNFNREFDALMLPRLFPNFPEQKLKDVASKIRASIISGLEKNSWLSSAARKKAILKIETAKLYLIKPQNDKEWDFVPTKTYSQTNRIDNHQLRVKARFEKDLEDLKAPVNREAWGMGPLTVNAYYDPSANKFVLPIGILQYPFFVADGDIVDNLGAVGAVMGHELGHGIDDQGSKYDEKGNLVQWMTDKDLADFSGRGKKMVEQFNKAGHNGLLTLGENIADFVGVTFAYRAAFPEGKASPEDKKRFFISYGRVWCNVARPKAEENQLKTNPHALGWARINEQMKQQPAFAEVFQCKKGDPMYLDPKDRVQVW